MKRIFAITLLFFTSFSLNAIAQDDFFDVDYNFIDRAFEGIKPVTNEEFEQTINKLTPQPVENTFKDKVRTFFFGRKYGVESAPKGQNQQIDIGGEKKAIQDLKNGTYYIKLIVSIVSATGDVIPLGNYKIQEKKEQNQNILVFSQGEKEYGYLKLRNFEDSPDAANSLTYSRIDIINDNIVRIVYSTLECTQCAYAKVYEN